MKRTQKLIERKTKELSNAIKASLSLDERREVIVYKLCRVAIHDLVIDDKQRNIDKFYRNVIETILFSGVTKAQFRKTVGCTEKTIDNILCGYSSIENHLARRISYEYNVNYVNGD